MAWLAGANGQLVLSCFFFSLLSVPLQKKMGHLAPNNLRLCVEDICVS